MQTENQLNRVFVYGTLRRGGRNERCWPHAPQSVEVAYAIGRIYDCGSYPAMTPGDHWIRGELWTLPMEQMVETLASLDELEGYRQREDDLYHRVVTQCHLGTQIHPSVAAYTYLYLKELPPEVEVRPNEDGICDWKS